MIVVLMGVTGSGKTTIGRLLAGRLGCPFLDGDDFHPPQNVSKMRAGTPLEDADRWPWLALLNARLRAERDAVLACSALKNAYREVLAHGVPDFHLVYLSGDIELIRSRLAVRKHRYMPASLLESQFAALEPPAGAITVDVAGSPEQCAQQICLALGRDAPQRMPG
jgi:gluconokinase